MEVKLIINRGYLNAKPLIYPDADTASDCCKLLPTPEIKRIATSLLIETADAYYVLKSRMSEITLIQQEFNFTTKSRIQANMNGYYLKGECYRSFAKQNVVILKEV